jgi:nucleoside-diphosphate-sugar epimerase
MNYMLWHIVDVRDVADALLLVYEKAESSGRYLCAPDRVSTKDLLNILKMTHPDYNYVNWWISYRAYVVRT